MSLREGFSDLAWIGILTGSLSGIVLGILLSLGSSPLIQKAEAFESKTIRTESSHAHPPGTASHSHAHSTDGEMQENGAKRVAWTILGTALLGLAFGILLSLWAYFFSWNLFLVEPTFARTLGQASLFGVSGFLIFFGLPSLGLPPELPGREAAPLDYPIRQTWWYSCVFSSLIGFIFLSFSLTKTKWKTPKAAFLGLSSLAFFIALPFLYGAPVLEEKTSAPKFLEQEFRILVWAINLLFWLLLSHSFFILWRRRIRFS